MKRIMLIVLLLTVFVFTLAAQQSLYVSARGNDSNDGLSEARPVQSLLAALLRAYRQSIRTITVIGTLDDNNFGSELRVGVVFNIGGFMYTANDITITGKPGASGAERAVLSAKGSGMGVVGVVSDANVRFEHIEITGGEGNTGSGIFIRDGGKVTLGPGSVVRGNESYGIWVMNGACVIEGGEVRDNQRGGVVIDEEGVGTMRSGVIRDNRSNEHGGGMIIVGHFSMSGGTITGNRAPNAGGGVVVFSEGRFDQTGGSISGNTAQIGGGIYIESGGRFDQTGGSISGNTDAQGYPNVAREQGSLGSNL